MKIKILNSTGTSIQEINKLEDELFINLSDEYKEFILENNEGIFETLCCFERKLNNDTQGIAFEKFLSINEVRKVDNSLKEYKEYNGLLAIGETLGSPVICLGILKENKGKIYILDWDFGPTLQSESFNEFLNELKACD